MATLILFQVLTKDLLFLVFDAVYIDPEGVQCKGTAKSKQDAKNRAAYQALLMLKWPVSDAFAVLVSAQRSVAPPVRR